MTRRHHVLLAAAVLLAAILRLVFVTELSLSHWDEGVYAGFGLGYGPGERGDPWIIYAPPVYPVLVALAYAVIAPEPWVAIVVAAVMGVLGVGLLARLTAAWFTPSAAVIAAFLLAIEPLHVAHSRMALTETTFCVGLLATLLFATRALESEGKRSVYFTGAWAGLATLTKFHGFLPLAAFGAMTLLQKKPRKAFAAAVAFVPAGLLALWLVHSTCGFERFSSSRAEWVNGLHPWSIRQTFEFAQILLIRESSIWIAFLAVLGVATFLLSRSRTKAPALGVVTLGLFCVVLCTYRNYARLFVPLVVLAIPFAAFMIDRVASRIGKPWGGLVACALLVLVAWSGGPALHRTVSFRGDGYARMAEVVRAEMAKTKDSVAVAVAQQSLFPYLGAEIAARVFSINEAEAVEHLQADTVRYLITDQDPWRHGRAAPFRETLSHRLVKIASLENPLHSTIVLDRLESGRRGRVARDADDSELDAERHLVLYAILPH